MVKLENVAHMNGTPFGELGAGEVGNIPAVDKNSPEVGESIPAIRFRRVVLPEPDGPMSERNSPRGTSSERSSSGLIVVFPLLKVLLTDLMEMSGFMTS